mgnify:CR=1 FL=1
MDSNVQTPKSRAVLVGLCAVALFLWTVAVYVTYQDAKMARYNVSIKPGAVNYGTHSTVTMPPVMRTSYRHSTPMISGDVVRAYAHTGHATMPVASNGSSSGFRIHTTSSATVHSIGGGGSTGGGMMSSIGGSSSRGIRNSGGSVSMPMLAFAASSSTVSSAYPSSGLSTPGMKKVKPNGDGEYNGEYYNGQWWNDDEENWVDEPFVGAIRYNGDVMERYDGSNWVPVNNQGDPGVPVGATPWILMLLLAGAYALYVRIKSRKYMNQ